MMRFFRSLAMTVTFLCLVGGYASAQTEVTGTNNGQLLQAGDQALQTGGNVSQPAARTVQTGEDALKVGEQALQSAASQSSNAAQLK